MYCRGLGTVSLWKGHLLKPSMLSKILVGHRGFWATSAVKTTSPVFPNILSITTHTCSCSESTAGFFANSQPSTDIHWIKDFSGDTLSQTALSSDGTGKDLKITSLWVSTCEQGYFMMSFKTLLIQDLVHGGCLVKFAELTGNESENVLAWELINSTIYTLSRYLFYWVLTMCLKVYKQN